MLLRRLQSLLANSRAQLKDLILKLANLPLKLKAGSTVIAATAIATLPFQNCGTQFKSASLSSTAIQSSQGLLPADCSFNGQAVVNGTQVTAWLNSVGTSDSPCISEVRSCQSGVLTGSYLYGSCASSGQASCLFNGETIPSGGTVTAYLASTVAEGSQCTSETRTCTNGVLSGSLQYASCQPNQAQACLFNGSTVPSGTTVPAFLNSIADSSGSCIAQGRTCINGNLSGSYNYGSCVISANAACEFNGVTVPSGGSVVAFQNSNAMSGTNCTSEIRTCNNGQLSGNYNFGSCTSTGPASCLFNGQTIPSGQSVNAFATSTVPATQSCVFQTRTCNDGVLSGSNSFSTCAPQAPASCLFNNQTIASGQTLTAYLSAQVPYGQSCNSQAQVRTCTNGTLDGSATYASCAALPPASCHFNGQTYADGQSISAFSAATVPYGQSCSRVAESLSCSNGSLMLNGAAVDSSIPFPTCSPQPPANCQFNGQTIASGGSTPAYAVNQVPYGQPCSAQLQTRVCMNGTLSGSATFASCSVGQAPPCVFNGQNYTNGQTVQAFSTATVPYGQQCSSVAETLTCSDGVLTQSGVAATGVPSCSPLPPATCQFNGQTIASGASTPAYAVNQVPFGQSCSSQLQQRTCTNGVLSGSSTYSSCQTAPAAPCVFNGQTYAHGQTVPAFSAATVPYGQQCSSIAETLTCNNGTLTGGGSTTPVATCEPTPGQACTLSTGQSISSGQSTQTFTQSTVPYGQTCSTVEQDATCVNGSFTGGANYYSCQPLPAPPPTCQIAGQTLNDGDSITVFPLNSYTNQYTGDKCMQLSKTVTCSQGQLMSQGLLVQASNYPYSYCQVISATGTMTYVSLNVASNSTDYDIGAHLQALGLQIPSANNYNHLSVYMNISKGVTLTASDSNHSALSTGAPPANVNNLGESIILTNNGMISSPNGGSAILANTPDTVPSDRYLNPATEMTISRLSVGTVNGPILITAANSAVVFADPPSGTNINGIKVQNPSSLSLGPVSAGAKASFTVSLQNTSAKTANIQTLIPYLPSRNVLMATCPWRFNVLQPTISSLSPNTNVTVGASYNPLAGDYALIQGNSPNPTDPNTDCRSSGYNQASFLIFIDSVVVTYGAGDRGFAWQNLGAFIEEGGTYDFLNLQVNSNPPTISASPAP